MLRFASVATLVLVIGVLAMPGQASPDKISVRFGPHAELISPARVDVDVVIRCPEGMFIEGGPFVVFVFGEAAFGRGLLDTSTVVCDGKWHTYVVPVASDTPAVFSAGETGEATFSPFSGGAFPQIREKVGIVDRVPG